MGKNCKYGQNEYQHIILNIMPDPDMEHATPIIMNGDQLKKLNKKITLSQKIQ